MHPCGAVGQRGALGNRPDRGRWRTLFFCNEQNEKGEPVTWQGRQYQPYPIQGSGFELNGKGTSTRPTLTVSNLYGMVAGMAEDLQSLVGGTVVRRKVYARFLDAVNFVNGNSDADPEQEVISRWRIEQCSELSAVSASFVLATPTETDGAVFPGRITPSAPPQPSGSPPSRKCLSGDCHSQAVATVAGIPAGCATVPGSAAAAYPPYLQWQYPDCAAHAVHVLCLPAGWSAEPFFSQVVKRCLFLQLLLFHIQQRQRLNQLILTGQHTLFICRQLFPVQVADALLQGQKLFMRFSHPFSGNAC
ncbi:phage minor tail protein L [Shigella flexneri K-315]|uniref:Phage minor tail protein L n=1 Tax=Shigella flexneri K-315 TaxID=766150 RepID=I6CM67_SHIFL|nr:phage minor tail protein L [Shigella flexneri K-315]